MTWATYLARRAAAMCGYTDYSKRWRLRYTGGMSVVAGWYPDPYDPNSVRWWDGTQWTGEVRPAPTSQPNPTPTTPWAATGAASGTSPAQVGQPGLQVTDPAIPWSTNSSSAGTDPTIPWSATSPQVTDPATPWSTSSSPAGTDPTIPWSASSSQVTDPAVPWSTSSSPAGTDPTTADRGSWPWSGSASQVTPTAGDLDTPWARSQAASVTTRTADGAPSSRPSGSRGSAHGLLQQWLQAPHAKRNTAVMVVVVLLLAIGIIASLVHHTKHTAPTVRSSSHAAHTVPATQTPRQIAQIAVAQLQAKDWTGLCAYVLPSVKAQCLHQERAATSLAGLVQFRHLRVVGVDVVGNRAIAFVSGTYCTPTYNFTYSGTSEHTTSTTQCRAFLVPPTPATSAQFNSLYRQLVSNTRSDSNDASLPLVRMGGRWYISGPT